MLPVWETADRWCARSRRRTAAIVGFACRRASDSASRECSELISAASLAQSSAERVDDCRRSVASRSHEPADRKLVRTAPWTWSSATRRSRRTNSRTDAQRLGGYLETSQVSGDPDSPSRVAHHSRSRSPIRRSARRNPQAWPARRERESRGPGCHPPVRRSGRPAAQSARRGSSNIWHSEARHHSERHARGQREAQRSARPDRAAAGRVRYALTKQMETVAISVSLQAEVDAQVFGLHWRPLYRLKIAARDGLNGFGDYLATMTSLRVLPAHHSVVAGHDPDRAALAWRILRWSLACLLQYFRNPQSEKGAN